MMYLYELKKILRRKSTIIAVGVLLIGITLTLVSNINNGYDNSWVDASGKSIYGIKAIEKKKEIMSRWSGLLTQEAIAKVIEKNRQIVNNPKYKTKDGLSNQGYAKTQGFDDIRTLINYSFGGFQSYDDRTVDSLKPKAAERFYTNRIDTLKKWLGRSDIKDMYSKKEKKFFINLAETLKTPLRYSYATGWKILLDSCSSVLYALAIFICVLLAPVFAQEYQCGADSIFLSTKNGKRKAILMKLLSAFTVTSIIYWIFFLGFSGVIFFVFGVDGASAPIQTNDYWKSFYHITNIEAFWRMAVLGYIGCLALGSFTLLLSARLKTSFSSIIVSFLIIMGPALLGQASNSNLVQKIMMVFPYQTLGGNMILMKYQLYEIFGKIFTPFQFLPVEFIVIAIVLVPFTYYGFKKHEVL
ncbi:hypothetical protein [Clostridium oryzae]|uniref:ABC-2 family transporter protein n=1 Tax=Clostridium oryzae TaxID=1450648 RepID=A0A1V4IN09_9CLOT|nr:hypothetical protein [Clostridium oryzae]OPJ61442.1 ABC-2 family transporter protein [Clostridium oryzae]